MSLPITFKLGVSSTFAVCHTEQRTSKPLPVIMDDPSTLQTRASQISNLANALSKHLSQLGVAEPSFEHGLPAPLYANAPDSDVRTVAQSLLHSLDEFRALLTEPTLLLTPELVSLRISELLCFKIDGLVTADQSSLSIVRLGIAENFPSHGTTVKDLAGQLSIGESLLRRLLAHCATHHIYHQSESDCFVHTAASRVLAENEGMRKWILIGAEELIPATLKVSAIGFAYCLACGLASAEKDYIYRLHSQARRSVILART